MKQPSEDQRTNHKTTSTTNRNDHTERLSQTLYTFAVALRRPAPLRGDGVVGA
jgi:hypothetical protein